jgi:hypothetical protein
VWECRKGGKPYSRITTPFLYVLELVGRMTSWISESKRYFTFAEAMFSQKTTNDPVTVHLTSSGESLPFSLID